MKAKMPIMALKKKKKNIQKHANPHDFDLSYNKGGRH
jgi:hypothetical protein